MLILGTGKESAGYTLLEVLAVIILIGLVSALAFPNLFLSVEKTELKQIAGLIQSDLMLARDEALTNQNEVEVTFSQNGYSFSLGDMEINRTFQHAQFEFLLPVNPDDIYTEPEAEPEEIGFPALAFGPAGTTAGFSINWKTSHFSGTLSVTEEGRFDWQHLQKDEETKDLR